MEKNEEIAEVELFSSTIEYEINQVCSILEDNKIQFVRKDFGSGSYMNLYYGQSIQEKKIFVHRNDYERAAEIILSIFPNDGLQDSDEMINQDMEEDDANNKKYKLIKDSFKIYILAMSLIAIILFIIAYITQS